MTESVDLSKLTGVAGAGTAIGQASVQDLMLAAQVDAEKQKKEQELANAIAANLAASQQFNKQVIKSKGVVVFYARGDGSRYCFEDGGVAEFVGGRYEMNPDVVADDYIAPVARTGQAQQTREQGWARRFEELTYVCNVPNPVFSAVPVPVHKSDSMVLREIGHSGGGIGMVGSFQTGQNLKASNG